jgi:hypothetical protein
LTTSNADNDDDNEKNVGSRRHDEENPGSRRHAQNTVPLSGWFVLLFLDASFRVRPEARVWSLAMSPRTVIIIVVVASSRTDPYDDVVDVTSFSALDAVETNKSWSSSPAALDEAKIFSKSVVVGESSRTDFCLVFAVVGARRVAEIKCCRWRCRPEPISYTVATAGIWPPRQ